GAVDVDWDWKVGQPEIQVSVDRLRAADAGLSVAEVARAARAALEGEVAGVFRGGSKEVDLRVRMGGLDKENPEEVGRILLSNARGVNYRLNQVAAVGAGTGPTEIRRKDRERLITVTANLQGRSLGDVSREIEARSKKLALPEGYQVSMSGETENMTSSFQDLVFALGLSVVLVYVVLVMLYESYLTPVIRMLALPLGLVGALFGLLLTGKTLNLLSIIGIIMLDGLVAKNGTLLIDYTNTLLSRGLSLREALVEAGVTRLRPIVMTSTTMIFGMLPTALALAEGSELRSSMAVVLIGGLITSTVMTLVAIPVAYTLVDDFRKWAGAKFAALANLFRAKKGEIA
ncbi:MAG: efflux RND transporter permease subunit, partial [Actinobacteria bacterium]|nr:efflux RND transporter permease subunit [Actinomycetota bacterium]